MAEIPPEPRALVGRRLLALAYDFFPALGLWFLVGGIALLMRGGQPIASGTLAGWLELLALWAVTGAYATLSWQRGGQTLGMRPWHLHVRGAHGPPSMRALWLRYAMGTLSLLCGGLGFWWAWLDRDKLTWHDLASGTRLARRGE